MDDRLGLNPGEARELKLGTTFSSHHNAFHTLKYDFKPASVDLNKEATVEVGTANQVQVTVPHLDGSGVPKTVFKGNQKKYTKECVIIIDKNTGEIVLERLSSNVSVKKTRSESGLKPNGQMSNIGTSSSASTSSGAGPAMKINENSTQRTVSKTKVSTGVRKKNNITGFVHKNSPNQLSDYSHHKSPQSAPAWNANNGQSTLPSIPMIDDDVEPLGMSQNHNNYQNHHHHQSSINHHNNHHQPQHQMPAQSMPQMNTNSATAPTEFMMSSSDSSSESSCSSDSDSSTHSDPPRPTAKAPQNVTNILSKDLSLSDDSD